MKDSDIFNQKELHWLYFKKPELKPIKVPTLDDAKTIRVPSINEANLLTEPSIDQIIIEFLRQYDVNVEPKNVGEWNGWDTLATLGILFSKEGSTNNIASTMFAANRSNQVSSAAQDWGTWKRWALDHKNFDQYKDDVIQRINSHNKNAIEEVEKLIIEAELHNKNAIEEIEQTIEKAKLHNENLVKKLQEQKTELKEYVSTFVESDNLRIKKERLKAIWISVFLLPIFLIGLIGISRYELNTINRKRESKERIQKIPKKKYVVTYQNGDKYDGEFLKNRRHGQGTYFFNNGDKYIGGWKYNKEHGQGTYFFNNGGKFTGEWVNGKQIGPRNYF